jgi:hypothetical protein
MGGIQYVHDWGTANYNAFSVKATRRFSNGLNVIASYTLGKSLDETSGIRSQGNDNCSAEQRVHLLRLRPFRVRCSQSDRWLGTLRTAHRTRQVVAG